MSGGAVPQFAGKVVPDPIEWRHMDPEADRTGLAGQVAAYHAARAQGFYLATLEGRSSHTIISSLVNEFHIACLYWAMEKGPVNPDALAAAVGTELRFSPDTIEQSLWEILTSAGVDPKSIAPFQDLADSR